MRGGGTINADGFGVGWYRRRAGAGALPAGDADLDATATCRRWPRSTVAGAVLAAVRSATVGMPVTDDRGRARSPTGRWLFSHNGVRRAAGRTRWPSSPSGCR